MVLGRWLLKKKSKKTARGLEWGETGERKLDRKDEGKKRKRRSKSGESEKLLFVRASGINNNRGAPCPMRLAGWSRGGLVRRLCSGTLQTDAYGVVH